MKNIPVALSLGGNLGNVPVTFENTIVELDMGGLKNIHRSSLYHTAPVGCAPGTPDFINAAITGIWSGSVEQLHELCKSLEVKFGRPRQHEHYGSRTLDLDIIFFGNELISTPELTIPHREAANRLFVLIPLAEIAPERQFPGTEKTVGEMEKSFSDTPEYQIIHGNRHHF